MQGKFSDVSGASGAAENLEDEVRQLRAQVQLLQKLDAVGRLVGGVAHDFNNLLTTIIGHCSLLASRSPPDEGLQESIRVIRKSADRASRLTRQLLAFSRKQLTEPVVLDADAFLKEICPLLRQMLGEDIELSVQFGARGAVRTDPGQLELAIFRLMADAREAMPTGGKLAIETGSTGEQVALKVSYTRHGTVAEEAIYLPLAGEQERPPLPDRGEPLPSGGTETVLVVEDQEAVRELVGYVLSAGGYIVLEARDGQDALAVARQHPGPLHLLVADVVLPGMSGRQLASELLSHHPELRVLFMSGHADDAVIRHGVQPTDRDFLKKPFTVAALMRKVRQVLDM